jgi:hypothetical protein
MQATPTLHILLPKTGYLARARMVNRVNDASVKISFVINTFTNKLHTGNIHLMMRNTIPTHPIIRKLNLHPPTIIAHFQTRRDNQAEILLLFLLPHTQNQLARNFDLIPMNKMLCMVFARMVHRVNDASVKISFVISTYTNKRHTNNIRLIRRVHRVILEPSPRPHIITHFRIHHDNKVDSSQERILPFPLHKMPCTAFVKMVYHANDASVKENSVINTYTNNHDPEKERN